MKTVNIYKLIKMSDIKNLQNATTSFSYNLINEDKKKKKINDLKSLTVQQRDEQESGQMEQNIKSIEDMWRSIEDQIEANHKEYFMPKSLKATPQCIRVFVSSTFTDFFSERESLVKKVFPKLREWCYDRNLDLIECDLRWGVPKGNVPR